MASSAQGCVWYQREFSVGSKRRGCHLITDEVVRNLPELANIKIGTMVLHIKHTSASLTLNENYDPSVRDDAEMILNKVIPENWPYTHTMEGSDDMPAHGKAMFLGNSVTMPITNGNLNLGTWQGIWLCEHRNRGSSRKLVATIQGAPK